MIDRISQHTFLARPLGSGAIVLDLGANRGAFTRGVLDRYGCRILAMEPLPTLVEAMPVDERVTVIQAAAAGEDGFATFTYGREAELSGSLLDKDVVAESLKDDIAIASVEALTLERILERSETQTVDLVKMDIEGAELAVILNSPSEALCRCKQITIEFHDYWYPELEEETAKAKRRLRELGFDMFRFTPNNKDILFVNRKLLPLTWVERIWIGCVLRNWYGLGRALRVGWHRVRTFRFK